jgi:predicted DsbA family dithiol-disulfide isomerase
MQTSVVESLFKSYFEEEGDITSHKVLADAATRGGLEAAEVKAWLDSDKGGPEVDREVQDAYMEGISGVPNFEINGKLQVNGGQDPEVFLRIFEEARAGEGSESVANGSSC